MCEFSAAYHRLSEHGEGADPEFMVALWNAYRAGELREVSPYDDPLFIAVDNAESARSQSRPSLPDMTESGWTVEQALRFYSEGRHFDVVDGHTRILDTGAVASDALKGMSHEYAERKGCVASSTRATDDDRMELLTMVQNIIEQKHRSPGLGNGPFSLKGWTIIRDALEAADTPSAIGECQGYSKGHATDRCGNCGKLREEHVHARPYPGVKVGDTYCKSCGSDNNAANSRCFICGSGQLAILRSTDSGAKKP